MPMLVLFLLMLGGHVLRLGFLLGRLRLDLNDGRVQLHRLIVLVDRGWLVIPGLVGRLVRLGITERAVLLDHAL